MTSADAFLAEWTRITTELTELVDTALDVEPPGECPERWARWLSRFEVARLDDDTRYADVRADGQASFGPQVFEAQDDGPPAKLTLPAADGRAGA